MQVFTMSDEDAFGLFRQIRWGETGGDPVCPHCGSEAAWFIRARKQWRCKSCNHTYSVTSGTIFADHKLPLKVYLGAIAIFANAAKGISALQLSRDLDVQYKTAYVLAHKLRESLLVQRDESALKEKVEVDGGYTGTYIRPANRKEDRIDRRKADTPRKRCILVMRQKKNLADTGRTLTYIVPGENAGDIVDVVTSSVVGGTAVYADECPGYDVLNAWYDLKRVNHSQEYSGPNGENTNQAESYFARFRRMQWGQNHKISPLYLANYANEVAYREDTRRYSNGAIFADILGKALRTPTSDEWCGYWQGNKRRQELLFAA